MTATKIDFKRLLHDHYSAARKPALVDVPELSFLMIDGHGDPNTSPEYREAVEARPRGDRLRRDAARGAVVER